MLLYFKDKNFYEYPNTIVSNELTDRFYKSVYTNSSEMELYYALTYMKEHSISVLSAIFPITELSVQYGREEDINKEFCDNNHIHYRYEERGGGCMVLCPDTIIFLDIYPTDNYLRQHSFVNEFVKWLKQKGIDAFTNNNDVMIGNKKVIGTISEILPKPYNNWVYFGAVISINSDPDLINQICTKPMIKVPGALFDYGLTTEEVMNWTLEWFNANQ